jgi:hypothetical protein
MRNSDDKGIIDGFKQPAQGRATDYNPLTPDAGPRARARATWNAGAEILVHWETRVGGHFTKGCAQTASMSCRRWTQDSNVMPNCRAHRRASAPRQYR